MYPYGIQSDPPYDQERIQVGRPPSRLEVQQHYLEHIRQRNIEMSGGSPRRPLFQPGMIVNLRQSLGRVLIGLGNRMARETGRATGPEVLARR